MAVLLEGANQEFHPHSPRHFLPLVLHLIPHPVSLFYNIQSTERVTQWQCQVKCTNLASVFCSIRLSFCTIVFLVSDEYIIRHTNTCFLQSTINKLHVLNPDQSNCRNTSSYICRFESAQLDERDDNRKLSDMSLW
jgi:hypothetical protein